MKWNRDVFLLNIEELVRDRCEGKLSELDRTVGMSGAFEAWKTGASPTIDAVFKICHAFDCDITWLINGYGKSGGPAMMSALVYIPKYRATLSGGGGSFETTAEVIETCPFGDVWLKERGNPGFMALFDVSGDSMAPTITNGSTVMVDRSRKGDEGQLKAAIYAFREGDTIKVKRLQHEDNFIRVLSDNPAEAVNYTADLDNFEIIGEVVWVARDL